MTISDEAVEAAKKAMQEITPPPGMTVEEWVARYGEYAWLAGCIAAAAPFIRAQALEEAAAIAGRPENRWWAEGQNRAKWLRLRAAEMRQG